MVRLLPLLAVPLLALLANPAQAAQKPVKAVMEWQGKFALDKELPQLKEVLKAGLITDEKTFGELWLAWRGDEKPKDRRLPAVDFEKQLVFVGIVKGFDSTLTLDLTEDDNGNLKGGIKSTEKAGNGFAYMIAVVDRNDIKTYNGKAVPAGKTIREGVDADDASILYAKPWKMNSGFKAYNGDAYDRVCLWIEPNTKLVLPDADTTVRRHEKENVLMIFMEKHMSFKYHIRKFVSIAERRKEMGCVVKLEKGSLLIGSFGEYSFLEGAVSMKMLILVPPKVEIVRRAGLIGGPGGRAGNERAPEAINPDRNDPRQALTKSVKNMPECWLPPTVEDGWHEIPAVADPERRVSKMNS